MPTSIIAANTTAESSSDITLADGASSTITLFAAEGGEIRGDQRVALEVKDAAGNYTTVDYLSPARPSLQILGPAVWRARRLVGTNAVGVVRD